ncbi:lipid II-degrading bacteriocin [Enterobacter kobei]|uniref:lipid II-degrading bacteriocin n=1 Tax=Enterobacter cloacae complex TaxID=354276 RepID=UPI00168AA5B4|nr:lipid II-degrading bacteriocin [Enterobacter kobei]MBD3598754.1 lipid II-degrading bacteriocin [Enterobacter kobei]MCK6794844.1 lipid II-degrading bacteriocin [Enterobacter kobei]MCK7293093.1 lipid II-degrading bacteriocin [Enterobacter kobei]MCM7498847.1 lipid II-degrading bacteriocin [Enterobacter kobei]MDA4733753.1 lipid II-degrading bacteriocin [Enterobacter kobei]
MDTIVVTAPSPSTNLPSYGNGEFSPSAPNVPGAGPLLVQVVYSFFQSPNLCLQALTQLEDYIKKHGAKDPLTLQVISTNVGYFCNADRNLILHPGASVYDAYHLGKPAPNKYDYRSMNIKEMSGQAPTPVVAFGHYLWGDGAERSVKLSNLGLKISPKEIPAIANIINSSVVGTFPISANFTRNTATDSAITGAYLGNITLATQGTLTVAANGSWSYNGVVRAYNDKYDFNPSTHRGAIAEALTRLAALYPGKTYSIAIPGQINIQGSGKR